MDIYKKKSGRERGREMRRGRDRERGGERVSLVNSLGIIGTLS